MTARSRPLVPTPVLAGIVLALVASVLVTLSAPSASAVRPRNDHVTMPRSCVAAGDLIPQVPTVCELTTFVSSRPTVLLWGDSHAWQMIPGLRKAAVGKDVNLVAIVMGGCPPMDNKVRADAQAAQCFRSNASAIDYARALVRSGSGSRVLLAASWQRYRAALKSRDQGYTGIVARAMRKATPRLMRTLAAMGAEVDVLGQVATVPASTRPCRRGNLPYSCAIPRTTALADSVATKRYLTEVMAPLASDARLINVNSFFCNGPVCKGLVERTHTWWDDLHLSASMSRKLRGFLVPTVEDAAGSRPVQDGAQDGGQGGRQSGRPANTLPLGMLC